MNKTFPVIDNKHVVDEQAEIKEGDWVYNTDDGVIGRAAFEGKLGFWVKVIATIGHQLKGLPMIRIEDEVEKYPSEFLRGKYGKFHADNQKFIYGYNEGYKSAQEKYKYTEKQIVKSINKGVHWASYKNYHKERFDEFIEAKTKEYLQSLNLPKQISQVTLEMEEKCLMCNAKYQESGCAYAGCGSMGTICQPKIHEQTPEGGIIAPVNVSYK